MKAQPQLNITEGVIWKQLLLFFFPLLYGTFFQQLYNTADAVIVGRFLGKEALAAVGGGTSTVITLLIGFFTGLSSGATVIISQFFGAGSGKELNRAVHTTIALALAGGVIITIAGIAYAPAMLKLLGTPPIILDTAVIYTRIFFSGILPSVIYNMGAGILRAIGDSKRPFYFLVIGTVFNIVFDLLFIAVFGWGVQGAAVASIISQTITMILMCRVLITTTESYRLIIREIRFDIPLFKRIIQIGLPTGLQSVMFTVSNLLIQSYINVFGTDTIAAWAVCDKISSLFGMIINSLGISISIFAGQNFGAHRIDRIRRGVHQSFIIAGIITVTISTLFVLGSRIFYRLFTDDQAVINEGIQILKFLAPAYITYISVELLAGAIRGCGKTLIPTILTCGGVCILRVLWLTFSMKQYPSVMTVSASYPISWTITSILFICYYLYTSRRSFYLNENK